MHDEQHAGDVFITARKSLVGWDNALLPQLSWGALERYAEHLLSKFTIFSIIQPDDRRVPRVGGVQIVEVAAGDEINIVLRGHEVVAGAEHLHDQRIAPLTAACSPAASALRRMSSHCSRSCAMKGAPRRKVMISGQRPVTR